MSRIERWWDPLPRLRRNRCRFRTAKHAGRVVVIVMSVVLLSTRVSERPRNSEHTACYAFGPAMNPSAMIETPCS